MLSQIIFEVEKKPLNVLILERPLFENSRMDISVSVLCGLFYEADSTSWKDEW
jgi:hypothetical protein